MRRIIVTVDVDEESPLVGEALTELISARAPGARVNLAFEELPAGPDGIGAIRVDLGWARASRRLLSTSMPGARDAVRAVPGPDQAER